MSTRGCIARKTEQEFVGRYHHSDSYPTGLGKTLWDLYHGHFQENLTNMLEFLIDKHPAGWSTIVQTDFAKDPGFVNDFQDNNNRPQCYCHGDRSENRSSLTEKHLGGVDWSYVFSLGFNSMAIYYYGSFRTDILLDGKEPEWAEIEEQENG